MWRTTRPVRRRAFHALSRESAGYKTREGKKAGVKIRLLQESHEQGWDAYNADGLRTAFEAIERLGGGAPASRSWPIGPCYTLREDAPHHDLKAGDTVITSPEPGWRDDGLYVIRLMGDDGEVPRVASQIK